MPPQTTQADRPAGQVRGALTTSGFQSRHFRRPGPLLYSQLMLCSFCCAMSPQRGCTAEGSSARPGGEVSGPLMRRSCVLGQAVSRSDNCETSDVGQDEILLLIRLEVRLYVQIPCPIAMPTSKI